MAATVARRLFTVDEYERMLTAGILTECDRVELIAGEIVYMSPIGVPHARCVAMLNNLLVHLAGRAVLVNVQNPIRLEPDSEPEPDLVLIPRNWPWQTHPTPAAIFLLIEVADTSLMFDRRRKLPLYAAAGIAEVWLVDIEGAVIERHSEPGARGYRLIARAARGEALTSTVLPAVKLAVDEVLG